MSPLEQYLKSMRYQFTYLIFNMRFPMPPPPLPSWTTYTCCGFRPCSDKWHWSNLLNKTCCLSALLSATSRTTSNTALPIMPRANGTNCVVKITKHKHKRMKKTKGGVCDQSICCRCNGIMQCRQQVKSCDVKEGRAWRNAEMRVSRVSALDSKNLFFDCFGNSSKLLVTFLRSIIIPPPNVTSYSKPRATNQEQPQHWVAQQVTVPWPSRTSSLTSSLNFVPQFSSSTPKISQNSPKFSHNSLIKKEFAAKFQNFKISSWKFLKFLSASGEHAHPLFDKFPLL